MFENIETFYHNFRVFFSRIFEFMTCRTKSGYQDCNQEYDEDYNYSNQI